jgi:probable rRNA maturation factor
MPVRLMVQEGPHAGVPRVEIRRRAAKMLAALELPDAELSVVLTGDTGIQELNRVYRKKDKPTDVLAFAQREGPLAGLAEALLGDVVVSVPTARRQAAARRVELLSELTMLMAHGILHLLGWDHADDASDRRMRRETRRLCDAATPRTETKAVATKVSPKKRPRRKSSRRSGT